MKKILFLCGLFIVTMFNTAVYAKYCVLPDGSIMESVTSKKITQGRIICQSDGTFVLREAGTGNMIPLSIEEVSNYTGIKIDDEAYEAGEELADDKERQDIEKERRREIERTSQCNYTDSSGQSLASDQKILLLNGGTVRCASGIFTFINENGDESVISPEKATEILNNNRKEVEEFYYETLKANQESETPTDKPQPELAKTTSTESAQTSASSGSAATSSAETTQTTSPDAEKAEQSQPKPVATTPAETTQTTPPDAGKAEQSQPKQAATTPAESAQTTPPDAGKILDDKAESGKKTDLSNQSVEGSTKQSTDGETAAMQSETGKTTSGNVEKSNFVGASRLSDDYGMGNCGSGNIFQQLACRAGVIGSGLKTVGYMIAGFGLIVFSFAAIFGKVKWPLFATIMFSCFLLSATVFVVNMMTKSGDASWIGGIKSGGFDYSSTAMPQGNVDEVAVTKETM